METLRVITTVIFFILSVVLVIVVLMQSNRGGGLSGMLGGASNTTFGSSAGDVMGRITQWLGGLYFLVCITFAILYYKKPVKFEDVNQLQKEQESYLKKPAENQEKEADQGMSAPQDDATTPAGEPAPANP